LHFGPFQRDGFTLLVDPAVVAPAQEHEVVEIGGATVDPVSDVVAVAPPLGTVAAGITTPAVPGDQPPPDRRGNGAGSPPDIERLGGPLRNDPGDPGITGKSEGGVRRDDAELIGFTGLPGTVL
jgi:hypothetical protein